MTTKTLAPAQALSQALSVSPYRTDLRACSCPDFYYRRARNHDYCKHQIELSNAIAVLIKYGYGETKPLTL